MQPFILDACLIASIYPSVGAGKDRFSDQENELESVSGLTKRRYGPYPNLKKFECCRDSQRINMCDSFKEQMQIDSKTTGF